jgi:hypothetical protein
MARALTHRASPAPVPVELLMHLLVESGVGDSGGPGGHEGARRFREEQQRRVEQGGAESGIDDADADRDFRWRSRRVTPDCCCGVAAPPCSTHCCCSSWNLRAPPWPPGPPLSPTPDSKSRSMMRSYSVICGRRWQQRCASHSRIPDKLSPWCASGPSRSHRRARRRAHSADRRDPWSRDRPGFV